MFRILLSSVLAISLLIHTQNVFANSQTFDKCWDLLNKKVEDDIVSSFPSLKDLMEKDKGFRYKYFDLVKMQVPIAKEDTHLNSLIAFFHGASTGDRQLLITTDMTGYIFYKELNGTNVLLKLKRGTKKWEVIEQSKIRGKYITMSQINKNCVKNH